MRYWVGFDVAKAFHWVSVLDDEGNEVLSRRVEATEEDLEALCSEVVRLGGERAMGIDLVGGPAALDQLAAAAGIAPVLRSSGALSYRRRARRGNKDLKDVFYRSALYALPHHETSRSFYQRKRDEGKGHHQAVLALARRRVNVLWAMLRDGRAYEEQAAKAA